MRRTKIVAAMLSLVFVFMLFPSLRVSAASSGECGTDLTYTLDDDGNLTISGTGNKIDSATFFNNTSITTVTLPDSVTSIGFSAFYGCKSLETIEMPEVTSIEDQAFDGCTSLKTIEMPKVTSIGFCAFYGCTSLNTIEMPEVTSIGEQAFRKCTSLETIEMPEATLIGAFAFSVCTSLETIEMPEVTSIDSSAFNGCTSLKTIEMPEVTSIGQQAFRGCIRLETIEMPEVTSIDFSAFYGCTSLTSITMDYSLKDQCETKGVFDGCPSNLEIKYYEYKITYKDDTNGTVSGVSASHSTEDIELTVTPNKNFEIEKVTLTDSTGTTELSANASGIYSFTMPKEDVTVEATFKRVKADVTFYSDDGTTVLQTTNYDLNEIPAFNGTPTKTGDAQYSYAFKGWNDGSKTYGPTEALPAVTDDASYTAVFESSINEYTVTFTDADGNQLQSGKLPYGSVPAYNGTPTKAETDKYTYTFAGWKSGNSTYGASSTLPQVSADVTYTAVFTETAKPTTTPAPGTYYVQSIEEKDGAIIITIKRTENDDQTFELVQSIETDGKQLTVGDQIELTSGSAIITIKKDFVSTLTPGTHTMKVTFKDGGSITLEYTVKEPEKAAAQAVQATGEATALTAFVGIVMILSACGMALFAMRIRKEETR